MLIYLSYERLIRSLDSRKLRRHIMSTATRAVLLACGHVSRGPESLGYSDPEAGATSLGYSEPAEPAYVEDLDASPQGYAEPRQGGTASTPSSPYVETLQTSGEADVSTEPHEQAQQPKEPETPYRLAGKHWLSARATCQAQLRKVEQAILVAYADSQDLEWIEQTAKNLYQVLWPLDHQLSDAVWSIEEAETKRKRQMALEESRTLIAAFRKYLGEEPMVELIDSNPFVPVSLGQTLGVALTDVAAVVNAQIA
jgi:hypothetical protein